jgi:hypothetical protein
MKNIPVRPALGMGLLFLFMNTASAQWVQINEPRGEYISALLVNDGIILTGNCSLATSETFNGCHIFRSTNNGTGWIEADSGLTECPSIYGRFHPIVSFALSGGNIFAATARGIYLSANNGTNWAIVDTNSCDSLKTGLIGDGAIITSLAANDSTIFVGTRAISNGTMTPFSKGSPVGSIFRSINNGTSWTEVNSGLPNYNVIHFLVANGNDIFAGVSFYSIAPCYPNLCDLPPIVTLVNAGIFHSTNNGSSWTRDSGVLANSYVNCLAVCGSGIFAGTLRGVFLSADNGTSWAAVNSGLTNDTVLSLSASGGNIFAGTEGGGVFLSTNNGTSWAPVNSGLMSNRVLSLVVFGNNLFAGTNSGVWRRPLAEMIGETHAQLRQKVLQQGDFNLRPLLHHNTNISIEFSLSRAIPISIHLYNLLGHKIACLANTTLNAGSYCFTWDTRNVARGCYTLRIKAGTNSYSKSIPLIR